MGNLLCGASRRRALEDKSGKPPAAGKETQVAGKEAFSMTAYYADAFREMPQEGWDKLNARFNSKIQTKEAPKEPAAKAFSMTAYYKDGFRVMPQEGWDKVHARFSNKGEVEKAPKKPTPEAFSMAAYYKDGFRVMPQEGWDKVHARFPRASEVKQAPKKPSAEAFSMATYYMDGFRTMPQEGWDRVHARFGKKGEAEKGPKKPTPETKKLSFEPGAFSMAAYYTDAFREMPQEGWDKVAARFSNNNNKPKADPKTTKEAPVVPKEADPSAPLSEVEVKMVKDTWASVAVLGVEAVGIALFRNIFEIAPGALQLFSFKNEPDLYNSPKLKSHGKQVVSTVGIAVGKLQQLDVLVPVLQELGTKHVGYGVKEDHYGVVGQALLKTLDDALGASFKPEVELAWKKVYGLVMKTMVDAAREASVVA